MGISQRKITTILTWIMIRTWASGAGIQMPDKTEFQPVVNQLSEYMNTALRSNPAIQSAWYNWQRELKQVAA